MDTKTFLSIQIVTWTLLLVAIFAFGSLGFYIFCFYQNALSKDSANWAHFASFIGGLMGPLLSFY